MKRKKISFKKYLPFKRTTILKLSTIILILSFFSFSISLVISCSPKSTADDEIGEDVKASDQITSEELEDSTALTEEEKVDYDTVKVGAEIKGFIPSYLCINKDNFIKIEITNTSDFTWKSNGENMVRIGYHYYGQDVEYTEYDKTTRTKLPTDVKPGETVTVEVLINDIKNEGIYVLQIDPVLEGKFWFSSKEVPMLEGTVYFGPCSD